MTFIGTWANELGSEMVISSQNPVTEPGGSASHQIISGTYRTRVGVDNNGERFPLTGWVSNDLITFSVSFVRNDQDGFHQSICAWAGQFLPAQRSDGTFDPGDQKVEIKTTWHLVPDLSAPDDGGVYGWLLAHSGANSFRRI